MSCRLAAGSTRFCAGILSTARHLTIEQKMADYSNKLYHQLEQETGIQTGKQVIRRPPVSLWCGLRGSGPSAPGTASARGFGGQDSSPRPALPLAGVFSWRESVSVLRCVPFPCPPVEGIRPYPGSFPEPVILRM